MNREGSEGQNALFKRTDAYRKVIFSNLLNEVTKDLILGQLTAAMFEEARIGSSING